MSRKDWLRKEKELHDWEEAKKRERDKMNGIDLFKERSLNEKRRQKEKEEQINDAYKDFLHKIKSLIVKQFELLYIQKKHKNEKEYQETKINLVSSKKKLIEILQKLGVEDAFEEIIIDCKNSGITKAKERLQTLAYDRRKYIEAIVDETFQKSDNETTLEEASHNPYSFPSLEEIKLQIQKIKDQKDFRSLAEGLINTYDKIDIDCLEDDDNIEENKQIAKKLIKSVLSKKSREDFIIYIDDLDEDNQFVNTAKCFVNLINDIYKSGLTTIEVETGKLKFPFALDSNKIIDFISNTENSLNDKITKLIDVTDNLIDRFDKKIN